MTGRSLKHVQDGPSSRMKLAIILMLLIILLPSMLVSLPLAKIVVIVTNTDTSNGVTVSGYVEGASDGYFYFNLIPGDDYTLTYHVRPGTHYISIHYTYPDEGYYGNSLGDSSTVWPFQVDEVRFNLVD
jgi:hypothetical protein